MKSAESPELPLWLVALRWVGVLPCATIVWLVATVVLYYVYPLLMQFGSRGAGDGIWGGFLLNVFCTFLCGGVSGWAFVYVGGWVAPSYKRETALVMAGLGLMLVGSFIFVGVMQRNYWGIFHFVSGALGIGAMVVSVWKREFFSEGREDNNW